MKLLYSSVSTKTQFILDFKDFFVNNPSFHIGIGSPPLTRKSHDEHNDTYNDLPSTFLLDELAFKSHLQAQKGPLWS